MLYYYKVADKDGNIVDGSIDASTMDGAIEALQRRGIIIVSIEPAKKDSFFAKNIEFFNRVKTKDVVLLSRQLSTLVGANVSIVQIFKLLSVQAENSSLQEKLMQIVDDIEGGVALSASLGKHPRVFSSFYVNMIKAAEESGKLPETFNYLADYLERSYTLTQKARNALIYPIFVVIVFIAVMILMLTLVIPQLTTILTESGQEVPLFTKLIIGTSDFFIRYGVLLVILLVALVVVVLRFAKTTKGKMSLERFQMGVPYIGSLYMRLYLARMSDSLNMLLESGIPMLRSIEITSDVVGSEIYKAILGEVAEEIKGGSSVSQALSQYKEIPQMVTQMTRIGEETGKLGNVLETVSRFYTQEVKNAIDVLVGLIEPLLVVFLGLGVAVLLAGILMPIYNLTGAF